MTLRFGIAFYLVDRTICDINLAFCSFHHFKLNLEVMGLWSRLKSPKTTQPCLIGSSCVRLCVWWVRLGSALRSPYSVVEGKWGLCFPQLIEQAACQPARQTNSQTGWKTDGKRNRGKGGQPGRETLRTCRQRDRQRRRQTDKQAGRRPGGQVETRRWSQPVPPNDRVTQTENKEGEEKEKHWHSSPQTLAPPHSLLASVAVCLSYPLFYLLSLFTHSVFFLVFFSRFSPWNHFLLTLFSPSLVQLPYNLL